MFVLAGAKSAQYFHLTLDGCAGRHTLSVPRCDLTVQCQLLNISITKKNKYIKKKRDKQTKKTGNEPSLAYNVG